MTIRKQQSHEVQDTEQQAEVAEAGATVETSTKEEGIKRSETKYDPNPDGMARVFESSTHQYLIYYRHDKSFNGLLVGLAVWMIQFGLYITMLTEGMGAVSAGYAQPKPIFVKKGICIPEEGEATAESLADNLECDPSDVEFGMGLIGSLTVAICLITSFLMYDIIAFMKVNRGASGRWAKMGALFVFLLTAMAFFTAMTFAFVGVDNGSSYDALVNCVGVLFIHDIDEKVYEAWSAIDKTEAVWLKALCCFRRLDCCLRNLRFALSARTFCCAVVSGFMAILFISLFYGQNENYEEFYDDYDITPYPTYPTVAGDGGGDWPSYPTIQQ